MPPRGAEYVVQRQRGQEEQLTLAIVMLLAVIVLAAVLIWVIMYNASCSAVDQVSKAVRINVVGPAKCMHFEPPLADA